ncbi:MAG: glycolate oxidase subunit GlcE [Pseudomonadota bacterium]
MIGSDDSDRIVDQIRATVDRQGAVTLLGQGTKHAVFRNLQPEGGSALSAAEHTGILAYVPDELMIEARSGTRLREIEQALAERHQRLAFEPPRFGSGGTLGGAVATGLAGPARPWAGAPRDALLGVELVNGAAERLRFGGRVVKNVAGYDVTRLQAGAFGTLGCLLSIALRVMPEPQHTQTMNCSLEEHAVGEQLHQWHLAGVPMAGTCWHAEQLYIRLSGPKSAVRAAAERLHNDRGARETLSGELWTNLRDRRHEFFLDPPFGTDLYRASLPFGAPPLGVDAPLLVEWRGAQRWYWLRPDQVALAEYAATAVGGWLQAATEPPLAAGAQPGAARIQQRLRDAFDPGRCLNPHLDARDAD